MLTDYLTNYILLVNLEAFTAYHDVRPVIERNDLTLEETDSSIATKNKNYAANYIRSVQRS